jgi:hypothetical protein
MTGQTRPRHITLRVTEQGALEVQRLAQQDKSVSAYLRRLIIEDKKRRSK